MDRGHVRRRIQQTEMILLLILKKKLKRFLKASERRRYTVCFF